ncbi:MAG: YheU family protein [Bdellovibrionales bacterium]|nr:YheU family protein [Bdellovibrionales bacterium]
MEKETPPPPLEIPLTAVDSETLRRIIEEFVLREGTDYGAVEVSLETKVAQIIKQLEKGHTKLYFDPESESVTLVRVR